MNEDDNEDDNEPSGEPPGKPSKPPGKPPKPPVEPPKPPVKPPKQPGKPPGKPPGEPQNIPKEPYDDSTDEQLQEGIRQINKELADIVESNDRLAELLEEESQAGKAELEEEQKRNGINFERYNAIRDSINEELRKRNEMKKEEEDEEIGPEVDEKNLLRNEIIPSETGFYPQGLLSLPNIDFTKYSNKNVVNDIAILKLAYEAFSKDITRTINDVLKGANAIAIEAVIKYNTPKIKEAIDQFMKLFDNLRLQKKLGWQAYELFMQIFIYIYEIPGIDQYEEVKIYILSKYKHISDLQKQKIKEKQEKLSMKEKKVDKSLQNAADKFDKEAKKTQSRDSPDYSKSGVKAIRDTISEVKNLLGTEKQDDIIKHFIERGARDDILKGVYTSLKDDRIAIIREQIEKSKKEKSPEPAGEGFLQRKNFPPSVRQFLFKHGHKQIIDIKACRMPIWKTIDYMLNILSLGSWSKNKKQMKYDSMFHTFLIIRFDFSSEWFIEKNEVIRVKPYKSTETDKCVYIRPSKPITVNELLYVPFDKYGQKYIEYDPVSANCQKFVLNTLECAGLLNNEIVDFIYQDADKVLSGYPYIVSKIITRFANRYDTLRYGQALEDDLD